MADYQLIVIGAGPGGCEAALRASELGMKTALIEKRDIGGTCLNRGCIPTKALLHASEIVALANDAKQFGVEAEITNVDMKVMFARKTAISAELRNGVEGLLENAGITIYRGHGTLCGTGSVTVTVDGETIPLSADHILIACGSVPAKPPLPGLDLEGVVTSDELLEGTGHLYQSLVIIGGGVIGVELAVFYSNLNCQVTIIEGMDRLLPNLDKEMGQNLSTILKKRGIKIYTNSMVSGITRDSDGMHVTFTNKETDCSAQGEYVLCAIGRTPNMEGILAEGVTLKMNRRQIEVDEYYQTSMPGVYAIGDVSARIQLAHIAAAQGRNCAEMLSGQKSTVNMGVIPSCVYCTPEIACVGMTADEAKAAGIQAAVGKYVMFSNSRNLIIDGPRSFIKIVAEQKSHRILGAQLMCERATDMISEFTEAIVNELTVEQMLLPIRPHPTFEEGATEALHDLAKKLDIEI